MDNLSYYFSIFRRRLPYFLIVATVISAVSVTVAYTLPPAYVSKMILLVESPQIPAELAASTVQTPAFEQLQIVEQRLLTRAHMIDIARQLEVLPDQQKMNADEIVDAMRARTKISTSSQRLMEAPLMTISFEAPKARTAAEVLNEYLTIIQQQDTEFRKGRSGDTLEFFAQEVARLSEELDAQSARILEFKQANTSALPESLQFRLDQHSELRDRLGQINIDISNLESQRERLMQLYELTGDVNNPGAVQLSPAEQKLKDLHDQLDNALLVYSPDNPRVKMLEARIAQIESSLPAAAPTTEDVGQEGEDTKPLPTVLIIQLSEIDSRVASLEEQKITVQAQIEVLSESISQTPEVSIVLEDLERQYANIERQYNQAESHLSTATTGDRIETRSRGQRLAVVEQPAIPTQPTKPNRIMIAGGGVSFGILAGLGLIILMEMLNTTARRPEDIVNRLGVTPLTTIPYIRTRGQRFLQRSTKLLLLLAILIGIPAVVFAIHTYYLPLDLIADRIMNKMGVRW